MVICHGGKVKQLPDWGCCVFCRKVKGDHEGSVLKILVDGGKGCGNSFTTGFKTLKEPVWVIEWTTIQKV